MSETLFIVNRYDDGRMIVIGKVTRNEEGFTYEPKNLDKDDTPRVKVIVETKELPVIAKRRLYSEKRPDIQGILERYGLKEYDAWELLKRTNGKLRSDNIIYVTEEELNIMKNDVPVEFFVDD